MICWKVKKTRNVVRHGGTGKQRYLVLKNALFQVEEYQAAHEEVCPQRDKEETYWSAPREGRYKANVDGSTFTET